MKSNRSSLKLLRFPPSLFFFLKTNSRLYELLSSVNPSVMKNKENPITKARFIICISREPSCMHNGFMISLPSRNELLNLEIRFFDKFNI